MADESRSSDTDKQTAGVTIGDVEGDIRDAVIAGRDIIQNIQNIHQRALTVVEEATRARELETQLLAQGVSTFAQHLQARASETHDSGGPYKGLLEYRLSDAEIFFGRDRDIREVLLHLDRGPLTVLHSESGAGKTSLLQAGISPRLIAAGHLPVYRRPYNVAPVLAIKQAFLPNSSVTPGLAAASLRDFLWQVCSVLGPHTTLYIFLDQFEEFFTQLDEKAHSEFVGELAECLDDESLNVRWGLALRTEFFGNLANFRPRIRNPFENDYRLNRLSRDEARKVIAKPAARDGITFEIGVIDTLLDDLGKDAIAPPQIQLVCSALYGELSNEKTITRELYNREGGAAGILRGHLERVLNRDVLVPQRPAARRLLESLISSELRRVIRTRTELLAELSVQGVAPETLDALLAQLIDSRLLRAQGEIAEGGELAYELAHDYLLDEIKLDPAVQARKAAQELLEREVQSYQRYGTLLSDDKLAILQPRQGELVLSEEAKLLLRKSEQAFKRRRGFLLGGIGLVITLVIIGAVSIMMAIGAGRQQRIAVETQHIAETAAAEAVDRESIAVTRRAVANQALQKAFEETGVIPVGNSPSALAFDTLREQLWVANADDSTVQAIDPDTGAINMTVGVDTGPSAMIFDGKWLWVANTVSGTVQAIDTATGAVGKSVQLAGAPIAMALSDVALWVAEDSENTLTLQAIDLDSGTARETVRAGHIFHTSPNPVAFDGSRLWVIGDGAVQVVDPKSQVVEKTIFVGGTLVPVSLAFDGAQMWVVAVDQLDIGYTLAVIDRTGDFLKRYVDVTLSSLDSSPSALAFDGGLLWVADELVGTVHAIDPAIGIVSVPIYAGSTPSAVASDGKWLWVADSAGNTVRRIDLTAGILFAPISVGTEPSAVVFDGRQLWIANKGDATIQAFDFDTGKTDKIVPVAESPSALAFDGRRLWVAGRDSGVVQSVDPIPGVVLTTTSVSAAPSALLFDGQRLWVAGADSKNILVINPATGVAGDAVQVVDRPIAMAFDGMRLWAGTAADTVQPIDPATGLVGEPVQTAPCLTALAFDGKDLWTAVEGGGALRGFVGTITGDKFVGVGSGNSRPSALTFDGIRLWVANYSDNTVQAIDPVTGKVGTPISVGGGPSALAFDGQRLWIANMSDGTVQAIYPTLTGRIR